MKPLLLSLCCALLLVACAASRDELSFEACAAFARESTERSRAFSNDQKRSFNIDKAASLATAREVEPGVTELRLIATIDDAQGKPSGQDIMCRTRFTEGVEKPDVIAFTLLLEGQ
jgi:hypothetical protein